MKAEKSRKKTFMDRYSTAVILTPIILISLLIFIFTRYSDMTTYIPFSGRVFDIDVETVEGINITDGPTQVDLLDGDDDKIHEIVDYLNAYHSDYWFPEPPVQRDGWQYNIALYTKDGACYSYEFTPGRILVNGIWYFSNDSYFDWLAELVEQERENSPEDE